jgi:hypothetical protein
MAALARGMNGTDAAAKASIDAIAARVIALEDQLGLPQPADPVAPEQTATG